VVTKRQQVYKARQGKACICTVQDARPMRKRDEQAQRSKQYAAMTKKMHTWEGFDYFPYRFLVPSSSPRPR
jgi:hypothetical protein